MLGLLDAGVAAGEIVRSGVDFGTRYRDGGLGRRPHRADGDGQRARPTSTPADRPLALVQGLAFVSRDTRGRPPWFPLLPLGGAAARRTGSTAGTAASSRPGRPTPPSARWPRPSPPAAPTEVADIMFAAVTDHVFIDGGHTIDFTNKAFEVLDHLGWDAAADGAPDARRPDRGGQPQRGAGRLALTPTTSPA